MDKIDFTVARLSKSIKKCPVCGRKARLSTSKTENKRTGQVFEHTDTFHHMGYMTETGIRVFYDLCIVDHIAKTEVSTICRPPV